MWYKKIFQKMGFTLAEDATHVDKPPIIAKAGFTLAEVLITLGIIGVVAAMTIPGLITNVQKTRTATELKKAFAEISVAVRMAESEYGDISGWTYDASTSSAIGAAGMFDTYLLPFMKISRKEVRGQDLIYYKPNNKRETGLAILRGNSVSYTLLSGVQMIVSNNSIWTLGGSTSHISLILDLNGYESMPNRFGRDTFYVMLYPNKGVFLHAEDDGEWGSKTRTRRELINGPSAQQYQCNPNGRGLWCGALIQKDGWKIAPDYPWN